MATVHFASPAKSAVLNAIAALINAGSTGGTIKIYTGTIPTDGDTAVTTQVLLGTLTFSKPCGTYASGTFTMSGITQDSSADATGTAAWARIADSTGNTVMDIDVGVTGGSACMQLNTTGIVERGPILVTAFTITMP